MRTPSSVIGKWLVSLLSVCLVAVALAGGTTSETAAAQSKKLPAHTVKSWGKVGGHARAGLRVKAAGFKWGPGAKKVKGEKVTYKWFIDGKKVKTGHAYRLPKSSKGKRLTLRVVVTAKGYNKRTKSFNRKVGRKTSGPTSCPPGYTLVVDSFGNSRCWNNVQQ